MPSKSQKERGSSVGGAGSEWSRVSARMAWPACPILASGTAGSALDLAAGWVRTCLAGLWLSARHPLALSPCIPAFPHSFLFLCGHVPVPLLSLPSDITAVCALFPNRSDLILIIPCQREKLVFLFFSLPTFPYASFSAFLYQSSAPFPCVSWSEHIMPVKNNGFYLLIGELFSPVLCSLVTPELCYFLWCLLSLETPLASTGVAQDLPAPCVQVDTHSFSWIITPTHCHSSVLRALQNFHWTSSYKMNFMSHIMGMKQLLLGRYVPGKTLQWISQ